jgi:hypothetical protein
MGIVSVLVCDFDLASRNAGRVGSVSSEFRGDGAFGFSKALGVLTVRLWLEISGTRQMGRFLMSGYFCGGGGSCRAGEGDGDVCVPVETIFGRWGVG